MGNHCPFGCSLSSSWQGPTSPRWRPRGAALKRLVELLLLTLSVAACSGSRAQGESVATPEAPAEGVAPQMDSSSAAEQSGYSSEESFGERLLTRQLSGSSGGAAPAPPPYGSKAKGLPPVKANTLPVPELVVYSGFLVLQVRRVLSTLDAITRLVESRGGYVESLTQHELVLRVPAKDFDAVMTEFATFGEVLDRRIHASDVTEQFTDLGARLGVAKQARARLLALLEQTEATAERLQIIAEIKRLTEQIEATESKLATLQNLVDFYTIRIQLVPSVAAGQAPTHRSPFDWIANLSAIAATLSAAEDFEWSIPRAFVRFDKADGFRAQSADTALLRVGSVDNEPRAEATFWAKAVEHEMLGRGEKLEQAGARGLVQYQVFVNDEVKPRYYLVGVLSHDDEVFVIEAFFPNPETYGKHSAAVLESFATFRPH